MASVIKVVVARASSRMFGGLSLSRNDDWIKVIEDFASDGFFGAQKIKAIPRPLRPLLAPFLPEVRRMKSHYKVAHRIIVPILEEREVESNKPSDFLQWMTDNAQGAENKPELIATLQLKLSHAALHTTAAAIIQVLYDLCLMPEYVEPLRNEIAEVQAKYPGLNKQALLELSKLDSFMRESMRHNPLLLS